MTRHRVAVCGMLGLIGCVGVIAADIVGILVYEAYNPLTQTISALAVGRYGWIQDIGLVVLGAGLATGGTGLLGWQRDGMAWRLGCMLMTLLAVVVVVIAFVNEYAGTRNVGADVHRFCFYATIVLVTLIPLLLAPGLHRAGRRRSATVSVAFAPIWLVLGATYLAISTGWNGAFERLLALLALAWFALVSNMLRRRGRAGASAEAPEPRARG